MKLNKKAEMGIGTLIIFIALLLVAAVAAGVLIQTAGSLQERALTTGDQAKGQISTNVRVIEVSAGEGQDSTLETFEQIAKLSPGSNAIKLEQTLLTMNTYDRTATLIYRGTSGTYENDATNGYYTLNVERLADAVNDSVTATSTEDYNADGIGDNYTLTGGWLTFNVGGTVINTTLDCSAALADVSGTYTAVSNDYIESVSVNGSCGGSQLNASSATVNVVPTNIGDGYFTVEYLQRGTNPVDGNLQTGDVIKIYYEGPREVVEDEEVRINFIPKIGTPTLTQFITPEVISTSRVYLYP